MRYIVVVVLASLSFGLVGCVSDTPMKAPCDYQGHFCGSKTRINS